MRTLTGGRLECRCCGNEQNAIHRFLDRVWIAANDPVRLGARHPVGTVVRKRSARSRSYVFVDAPSGSHNIVDGQGHFTVRTKPVGGNVLAPPLTSLRAQGGPS